jgi:hypothetical protein
MSLMVRVSDGDAQAHPKGCYWGNNTSNNILADLYVYQMCTAVDPIPYLSH